MQAAKGLDFLHNKASPTIAHGRKAAKLSAVKADDVCNFGVVLLELLSGRKADDRDCTPSSVVEWAAPLIRRGKAAAIIDRYVGLPRNVEPLLKLAEMAEASMREKACERPTMAEVAVFLEQLVKEGLVL